MNTPLSDNPNAALPSMALLATLQTATTVWEGVEARRAGRDPAAQEASGAARAFLETAAGELVRLHMQLLMANVQATRALDRNPGPDEAAPRKDDAPPLSKLTATVRRFDMLMKLRRTDRLLHGAHQRLMSLYPAVSEELVEEARRCRGQLSALRGAPSSTPDEDFDTPLGFFLQRLLSFAAWMEREL